MKHSAGRFMRGTPWTLQRSLRFLHVCILLRAAVHRHSWLTFYARPADRPITVCSQLFFDKLWSVKKDIGGLTGWMWQGETGWRTSCRYACRNGHACLQVHVHAYVQRSTFFVGFFFWTICWSDEIRRVAVCCVTLFGIFVSLFVSFSFFRHGKVFRLLRFLICWRTFRQIFRSCYCSTVRAGKWMRQSS